MIDKKISHRLKLLLYGCRILWKVSPKYYIAIVLLGILGGIVAPLIAIVWQQSLDVIALMLQTRDISMSIFLLLFLYSSLVFLTSLIAESLRYCKQTYSDMVKVSITNSILRKCTNYSMETYDDPEFYDYLTINGKEKTYENC